MIRAREGGNDGSSSKKGKGGERGGI